MGDIYLITLASNPENLLDIFRGQYASAEAAGPDVSFDRGYRGGLREAVELVRRLVEETWRCRRDTDVRSYLEDLPKEDAAGRTGD
ncbi:MAG: hypothetical protein ACLRT5_03915 [Lachnospiraceae bacterium]